jgi:hypothetical protein
VSVTSTRAFEPSGAVSVQLNSWPFSIFSPSGQSTEMSFGFTPP